MLIISLLGKNELVKRYSYSCYSYYFEVSKLPEYIYNYLYIN